MYRLIIGFFGLCADVFFKRHHLGGPPVPETGPIVVVANHPNGVSDPLMVTRTTKRPLRFLAKSPLFKTPVLGWFLRQVRALPVYRRQDGGDTSGNTAMFQAVSDALGAGEAICLFPEGISHAEPSLAPLRTGAARMVLQAEAQHGFRLGVRVVPVGLTFRDRQLFGSDVATETGEPITATDLEDAFARDPREAARTLTERIDASLRAVTLNLERWEDLPLMQVAAAISRASSTPTEDDSDGADNSMAADLASRTRAVAEATRELELVDPDRVGRLRRRVNRFIDRLDQAGVSVERLERGYTPSKVARFTLRNLAAIVFGLPLALLGVALYAVPYLLTNPVASLGKPDAVMLASAKLMTGILLFTIWQIGWTIAALVWAEPVWPALALLWVVGPLAGIYAARYRRRRSAAAREVRSWFAYAGGSGTKVIGRLIAERDAIAAELSHAQALLAAQAEGQVSA